MSDIETVKILVVGDSGVGKSSLVHLICRGEPCVKPSWTIGCVADVVIHEFREGLPAQRTFCVELWDVGGSAAHQNARSVFYAGAHGILLVHDLSNRKTQLNLLGWLTEVLNWASGSGSGSSTPAGDETEQQQPFDPEQFAGSGRQLPVLLVGCKLDLAGEQRAHAIRKASRLAEECGADEIQLSCVNRRALAAGTTNAVRLSRFFDKVIERRYYRDATATHHLPVQQQQFERRRPAAGGTVGGSTYVSLPNAASRFPGF